ncbi:MAG: beta-galactosidase, partial [Kiritimatiellae bacterium]|nr:beta-galactosidase [Kiritimatiellia bacterium]
MKPADGRGTDKRGAEYAGRGRIRPRRRTTAATLMLCALAGTGLAVLDAHEKFGFDTWTDNWKADVNPTTRGITSVVQSATHVWRGAHMLKMECDLAPAFPHNRGVAVVDMSEWCPFTVNVPVDLRNCDVYWVEEFNGYLDQPCGTDPAYRNQARFFLKDSLGRGVYPAWYSLPTNWVTRDLGFTVTTNAPSGGTIDPGFNPADIQYIGYEIQVPAGSTGTFRGPIYLDQVRFVAAPAAFTGHADDRYGFATNTQGFAVQTYVDSRACTNLAHAAAAPSNSTGCLAVDVHLVEGHANYSKGEVFVDMMNYPPPGVTAPVDLAGKRIEAWVYCPPGLGGPANNPNGVQVFCKDANWKSFYGSYEHITTGCWFSVSASPATTAPNHGYMDAGFDPAQVILVGFKVSAGSGSGATYDGKMYLDGFRFAAAVETNPPVVHTNDLRYGFEPNREGWFHEVYVGPDPARSITGIVGTAQSTNFALEGAHSLRMDVDIQAGTNRQQGAAVVDMRWYPPPPTVRAPYDLQGTTVYAYVYCPPGSGGADPGNPNYLKLIAKSTVDDTNWYSQIGTPTLIREGEWVELKLTIDTNTPPGGYMDPSFTPTSIVAVGVIVEMSGTYTGALYLDNVCFGLGASAAPEFITNSMHTYGFEEPEHADWWQWDTNPEGWHAKAWTQTYWAANEGWDGSMALAADAVFTTNNSAEVVTNGMGQVITNEFTFQKGVFEISYQPALHLATKDHRKIQARLRFDPPVEGLLSFDASISVYDKITDQWYTKNFKVGGSSWNVLDFDLDNPADYHDGRPPIPMHSESIGYVTIQIFGNIDWAGTIYLDEVAVGGRETGTAYDTIDTGFARADGHKFVIDGTNFYHCGANIEYLFSITYDQVMELLDLAASSHVHVVRTWAFHEGSPWSFQPRRGVWNTLAFEHLDRIVAEAGDRGIRLMLGLVDNWAHNGGMFQYLKWVEQEHPESVNLGLDPEGVEFHDQYWTNAWCRQWYRDYVSLLLNRTNSITGRRYKDDPTIFAWEIVNEPRAETDFSGRAIHDWLHEMSDWVRTLDTNHILSGGEEGGYISTYEYADSIPWEVLPDNYYHYAVFGAGSPTCDLFGCGRGHGVDFISDNSSADTYVQWQGGFYTNPGTLYGEWRPGNSNLNFATCRIYVDQKEYNVWRE